MLVLSRKVGERILIGDGIAITIVRISQGTVRIGVEAPRETPVIREEVLQALESDHSAENQKPDATNLPE